MSFNKYTVEELIVFCKQKNQKAQAELYNRYAGAMYNVSFRIVKDVHFAEDVMQEGFLKAFLKIDDYKQEVTFGAWLKRIIVNCSIDFYKKITNSNQKILRPHSIKWKKTKLLYLKMKILMN